MMKQAPGSCPKAAASVILATSHQPEWLRKSLWGYARQSRLDFELIVAADGSDAETRELIETMAPTLPFPIKFVWQEKNGFGKCRILNKAVFACSSDYLIFSDGDCIPRQDLVAGHLACRKSRRFLSHGTVRLPLAISQRLAEEDIASGRCFSIAWLKNQGMPLSRKTLKLTQPRFLAAVFNTLSPAKATWNGCGSSAWLEDIRQVNGFDMRMGYGGQDVEFGERLRFSGILPLTIRYTTTTLHLAHDRPYETEDMWQKNNAILAATRRKHSTWTPFGLSAVSLDMEKKGIVPVS